MQAPVEVGPARIEQRHDRARQPLHHVRPVGVDAPDPLPGNVLREELPLRREELEALGLPHE
jgi:hypothetical protein